MCYNKHTSNRKTTVHADIHHACIRLFAIQHSCLHYCVLPLLIPKAKFMGLKSHDYHCLIQQIIPAVSRTLLQPLQRTTLIRLGKSLNRICARVIDRAEILALRFYVIETLCYLELCFPPSFFDTMEHNSTTDWVFCNCNL